MIPLPRRNRRDHRPTKPQGREDHTQRREEISKAGGWYSFFKNERQRREAQKGNKK